MKCCEEACEAHVWPMPSLWLFQCEGRAATVPPPFKKQSLGAREMVAAWATTVTIATSAANRKSLRADLFWCQDLKNRKRSFKRKVRSERRAAVSGALSFISFDAWRCIARGEEVNP